MGMAGIRNEWKDPAKMDSRCVVRGCHNRTQQTRRVRQTPHACHPSFLREANFGFPDYSPTLIRRRSILSARLDAERHFYRNHTEEDNDAWENIPQIRGPNEQQQI